MSLTDKDYPLVLKDALRDAARTLVNSGADDVSPAALVFWVLKQAMETLKRMPDPESAWLYSQRSLWPDIVRTQQERLDAYAEDVKRLLSGEESVESLRRKVPAEPIAIKRMYVVFAEFPYLMVGKDNRRNYRIICGFAGGKSAQRIGKEIGMAKQTILDRKNLQLAAIAKKLGKIMPSQVDIKAMRAAHEANQRDRTARYLAGETCDSGV